MLHRFFCGSGGNRNRRSRFVPLGQRTLTRVRVLCTVTKWKWRESNPRPHEETIRFLHAYLGLHFRAVTRPKPPITTLSPKFSSPNRSARETISDLTCTA